jgi:transcriptional regulator with XRE-family HTH domain
VIATLFYNWLVMADAKGLDLVQLGQTIRSLRLGKGWSLAQLAEESTVSKAYLSDLENGSAGKPNIQYVYSVASALEVTLDELLGDAKPRAQRHEKRSETELPSGLLDLKKEMQLTDEDVQMLASVNFRGHRPRDKEGWRFLLQALRMVSQRSHQK